METHENGWIRKAREASFLSAGVLAGRLGITRAAWYKFEKSEPDGRITLRTLRQCAEVMDCELIYFFRPRLDPLATPGDNLSLGASWQRNSRVENLSKAAL